MTQKTGTNVPSQVRQQMEQDIQSICCPRSFWAVTIYLHRGIAPVVFSLCATRSFAEQVQKLARTMGYKDPEIVFWNEKNVNAVFGHR